MSVTILLNSSILSNKMLHVLLNVWTLVMTFVVVSTAEIMRSTDQGIGLTALTPLVVSVTTLAA